MLSCSGHKRRGLGHTHGPCWALCAWLRITSICAAHVWATQLHWHPPGMLQPHGELESSGLPVCNPCVAMGIANIHCSPASLTCSQACTAKMPGTFHSTCMSLGRHWYCLFPICRGTGWPRRMLESMHRKDARNVLFHLYEPERHLVLPIPNRQGDRKAKAPSRRTMVRHKVRGSYGVINPDTWMATSSLEPILAAMSPPWSCAVRCCIQGGLSTRCEGKLMKGP